MNWLADLHDGRRLVTVKDRSVAGCGVLSDTLLDLIAVARHRGRKPSPSEVRWVATMRGLTDEDARDLRSAMNGLRL